MRRAARRLGRLERNAGLLALIAAACFAAAGVRAAPGPELFELSVSGTAHAQWDHTDAPTTADGCERSLRSRGTRDVRFRSSRPAVVRFVGGRLSPADVRSLTGSVTLSGPNTLNETCGATETHTPQPCAKTSRSFAGGTVHLSTTKPGAITLGPLRIASLHRSGCPREPDDVVRAPLGPLPGPVRIPPATVANAKIIRITLTASASRRTTFGQPEAGKLTERAAWTFTLLRQRP